VGAVRRLKDGAQRYMLAPDPSGEARKALFGVSVVVTPFLSDAAIAADMSQVAIGVRDRRHRCSSTSADSRSLTRSLSG